MAVNILKAMDNFLKTLKRRIKDIYEKSKLCQSAVNFLQCMCIPIIMQFLTFISHAPNVNQVFKADPLYQPIAREGFKQNFVIQLLMLVG